MPNFNDFHAFKSTSSGGSGVGGGSGCFRPWMVIAVIVIFLMMLGRCSG